MPWIVALAPGHTIGAGLEYGFGTEGIPQAARQVGKQKDWLNSSPYGPDTRGFFKSNGFDIDDVGDDPVYEVPNEFGSRDFLIPFGKWYSSAHARNHVRWTRLRYREDLAAKQALTTQDSQDKLRAAQDRLKQIEAQEQEAAILAQIREKEARIAALQSGSVTPSGTTNVPAPAGSFRTYEVFGTLNGAKVPLSQVVVNQGGRYVLVPGGQALVGDAPTDGFGLAGVPGRWQSYYAGQSPAAVGLDADKGVLGWDGQRGWAVPAATLTQMFGADWRQKLYS